MTALNPPPTYNLDLPSAIERLKQEQAKHAAQADDPLITDMPSNAAWDVGYAQCIADLESLTGPDPMEVQFEVFERKEGGADE